MTNRVNGERDQHKHKWLWFLIVPFHPKSLGEKRERENFTKKRVWGKEREWYPM